MGAQQSHSQAAAMPQALLLHTSDEFLDDREAIAVVAATSRYVHHSLRAYKIKSVQSLWSMIDPPPPRLGTTVATSLVDTSSTFEQVSNSPWRIGRVQRVFTTIHDYNGLRRLSELPTSVKSLEFQPTVFPDQEDESVMSEWKTLEPPPSSITFPPSLTILTDINFDSPIEFHKCILPPQLVSIEFAYSSFMSPHITSQLVWPESLTQLIGAWTDDLEDFNQWKLPSNLRTLRFLESFNLPLVGITLPDSITDLLLGRKWCHSLKGVHLPSSLTVISCYTGNSSDYKEVTMKNVEWPIGLTSIVSCNAFNNNGYTLPDSLTELTFSYDSITHSEQRFPRSLTKLDMSETQMDHIWEHSDVFPNSLTQLYLSEMFNQDLSKVHLPSQLRTLVLGEKFNQSIDEVVFPESLTILQFGKSFNHPISAVRLPQSLIELHFGDKFNSSVAGMKLPARLLHLQFGEGFNQSVDELILPSSLTRLYMCGVFNQSIDRLKLPDSLTELSFDYPLPRRARRFYLNGSLFDQPLVNVKFPSVLTTLILSLEYNQSLVGVVFPPTLTLMNLGEKYNHSLNDVILPPHLRELKLGPAFNQSLVNVSLPSTITQLKLGREYNQCLEGVRFPSSLTSFIFQPKCYTLPLTHLWRLPPSCRELELTIRPPYSEVHLPNHIEVLQLHVVDNARPQTKSKRVQDADGGSSSVTNMTGLRFPSSLRVLTFTSRISLEGAVWSDTFSVSNPSSLLSNPPLLKITLEGGFNLPLLENHLPQSCTDLNLDDDWNLSVDQLVLPSRLKRLHTGQAFNQPIDKMILPSSLEVLAFGREFNQPIHLVKLPASLHSLLFDPDGQHYCRFSPEHYLTFIQSGALARTSIRDLRTQYFLCPLTLPPPSPPTDGTVQAAEGVEKKENSN